jgi:hypothetical protein
MRVSVSERARARITARGGRVYVWVVVQRSCSGPLRLLQASTRPPAGRHDFARVAQGGVELWLGTAGRDWPGELGIEAAGWLRPRLHAYWNGRVYLP